MSNPDAPATIYYLVYASSATVDFGPEDLLALLKKSRAKNHEAGITGILLYKDGNFMQALEGEKGAVQNTFARIGADPRHRGIIRLLEGQSQERQFPDWSMAFRDLNSTEARSTEGFNEFLNQSLAPKGLSENKTRCWKLLEVFRSSNR